MLVLAGDKNELVSSVVLKFTVGSTKTEKGDALSPGWLSVKNAYRLDEKDAQGIPKIPAQPIG